MSRSIAVRALVMEHDHCSATGAGSAVRRRLQLARLDLDAQIVGDPHRDRASSWGF
ncbi:hypothetical protein [Prauserella rugosa]|uniref:hypothetical protein n=1 Tax=Prauserella rugosa TaxID=43354 RepID=UPI0014793C0A|nr:hypothetical protein [Prauserella rugosa]